MYVNLLLSSSDNEDSGLPYIEVKSMSAITNNGLEPSLAGYIFDPSTKSEKRFAVDPKLFADGKIMVGWSKLLLVNDQVFAIIESGMLVCGFT